MLHWQSRTNERFHPFGHGGVAFDFNVRLFERASIPRIAIVDAGDRMLRVVELEIADDVCARRIGGANLAAAMHDARRLIEIGRLDDVHRNHRVVFAGLTHAIDLNRQKHRDADLFEFASDFDDLGGTPTVAVEDDAGVALFGERERAVVVRVQEAEDFPIGLIASAVFEDFDMNAGRVVVAKAGGELDASVRSSIVRNESANEADDDRRRRGRTEARGNVMD